MSHYKPSRVERQKRRQARRRILDAANTFRLNRRAPLHVKAWSKPYTAARLQDAVCCVRRNGLVPGAVLVAAGFKETN